MGQRFDRVVALPPTDSLAPRIISDYERALHADGRRHLGLFALEGYRLLERALSTSAPLTHVLLSDQAHLDPSPRLQTLLQNLQRNGEQLISIPQSTMERLTEGRTLGPILALAKIPASPDLPTFFSQLSLGSRSKILVLDEMMDPGNVGALLRTAHAMGVSAVFAIGGTDPYHPRAARTSMGSIFRVPTLRLTHVDPLLSLFRQHQIFTVGATPEAQTLLPSVVLPDQPVALFVGNEGKGLSSSVRPLLDLLVAIPMTNSVDSLSINAATAVTLYALTHPSKTRPV